MQDPARQNLRGVNHAAIAAVTLLLVTTLAFGVYPMYTQGQRNIQAAADKEAALQRVETLREDVKTARAEMQVSEIRLLDAEKRLPRGSPDSQFGKELNEVAKKAGIRVESMPPLSEPQSYGDYSAVVISVDGSGDWESCVRFLRGISGMNRITRLDLVVLDADQETSAQGHADPVCHMVVKFSTFYRE